MCTLISLSTVVIHNNLFISILCALTYLYLWRKTKIDIVHYWGLSWLVNVCRFLLELVSVKFPSLLLIRIVADTLRVYKATLLFRGVISLSEDSPVKHKRIQLITLISTILVVFNNLLLKSSPSMHISFVIAGSIHLASAYNLYNFAKKEKLTISYLLSTTVAMWGLNHLVIPFIGQMEYHVTIASLFGTTLLLLTSILMIVLTLEKAEQARKDSDKQLKMIHEFASDGILLVSNQDMILNSNRAAEKIYGYTRDELKNMRFSSLVISYDIDFSHTENIRETIHKRRDGTLFPVELSINNCQIGTKEYSIVIIRDISARKKTERELFKLKENLKVTLESIGDGVITFDNTGTIKIANRAANKLIGDHALISKKITDVLHLYKLVDKTPCPVTFDTIANHFMDHNQEFLAKRADGAFIDIEGSISPIHDSEGVIIGRVLVFRDITEKHAALRQLLESEQKYRTLYEEFETIFNTTQDAVFFIDVLADGSFRYRRNNKKHQEITGITSEYINGKTPEEIVGEKLGKQFTNNYLNCKIKRQAVAYEETLVFAGKERFYETVLAPVITNGQVIQIVGASRDITEQVKAKEQIIFLSYHDPLTGLYNRNYLEQNLKELDNEAKLPLSVILGDVNGLKMANDAFGHLEGDKLLQQAAKAMSHQLRPGDICARFGGDEFILILPNTDEKEANEIMTHILDWCESKRVDHNLRIKLSISLGVASRTSLTTSLHDLIKEADDHMYKKKLLESSSTRHAILTNLINYFESVGFYNASHQLRVQTDITQFAKYLGLSLAEVDNLSLLARTHDIGLIGIPIEIINKPSSLTESEWNAIKNHSEVGYHIARATDELAPVAEALLCHHENWDGSGYPQGRKGKDIPYYARILRLADSFDSITNNHPYKKARSFEAALEEIAACAGTQFDPELCEQYIQYKKRVSIYKGSEYV